MKQHVSATFLFSKSSLNANTRIIRTLLHVLSSSVLIGLHCSSLLQSPCKLTINISVCYQVTNMPHQPVLIVVSCVLFGFFAFALMPVCLKAGVECTYPATEKKQQVQVYSGWLGMLYTM